MKTVIKSWFSGYNVENRFISFVQNTVTAPVIAQILQNSQRNLIVVCPDTSSAENISSCLKEIEETMHTGRPIDFFPETAIDGRTMVPENEILRSRTLYETLSSPGTTKCIVASVNSFLSPLPSPKKMKKEILQLKTGMEISMKKLLTELVRLDYDDEYEVTTPGEFSRRGGIIDIFSPAHEDPVRIEFWGERIETMRFFSDETQLSSTSTSTYNVIPKNYSSAEDENCCLADYLGDGGVLAIVFPEQCRLHLGRFATKKDLAHWNAIINARENSPDTFFLLDELESDNYPDATRCECFPHSDLGRGLKEGEEGAATAIYVQQILADKIRQWADTGYSIFLTGRNNAGLECISDWCARFEMPGEYVISEISPLNFGFVVPTAKIAVLTEKDLYFSETHHRLPFIPSLSGRRSPGAFHQQFAEIDEGDFVAHCDYGVGIFRGIHESGEKGRKNEMFRIEYADEVTVDIPLWQANSFSRYFGAGKAVPKLNRIGSAKWRRSRIDAARAVMGLAAQMLNMQATRIQKPGFSFPSDDKEQHIFEESFPFRDTPDQKKATEEIKADMSSERPMDRLVCGDVGYGKTEVAARAAFKAVNAGKQVALLVPTTVLAQQHFYTFVERFAEHPVIIETISRFKGDSEQKEILKRLAEGKIDIIIGTHRIIQHDVEFANLGLLIIDEEQRFGVEAKEKLKRLRATVDILTLTATPIPRTLYMSIAGIRDLSAIMTPPEFRLPIQTIVCQYNEKIVASAIDAELQRGGQVYYLHNRVQSIEKTCFRLQQLIPSAKFAVAHGQLHASELEKIMSDFLDGKIDVLACTTIIQSGIDIPNANTILIERADRFGLAELYQLRGRVGRWTRQAYAYMLLPPKTILEGNARERIAAIRRYTQLGSGFRLALRDLEIRGAGNLLGHEQSGHINAIGFELYCSLLKRAVDELQAGKGKNLPEVSLFIDFLDFAYETAKDRIPAAIPPDYIPFEKLRVDFYRRTAKLADEKDFAAMEKELADRFGKIPPQIENLIMFFRIRLNLARAGAISLATKEREITLKLIPSTKRRKSEFFLQFDNDDAHKKFAMLEKMSSEINSMG